MLSHEQAKAFYDRFGSRQDWQRFYEDAATRELVAHADFGRARAVFELGCGTGRFAASLLDAQLPADATYRGVDVSTTMVDLARARLARFGERARVEPSDGSLDLDAPAGSHDRFVANYVLDLLSEEDIAAALASARRMLADGGLLCLTSLAPGATPIARVVTRGWEALHAWSPSLVGGCRPVALADFVREPAWKPRFARRVTRFGISSDVLVAEKAAD